MKRFDLLLATCAIINVVSYTVDENIMALVAGLGCIISLAARAVGEFLDDRE